MVRWLHISDLHIKNKADWNSFKIELIKKCKKIGKIDLVIVTGDFHNFIDKNDFSLAKEFLNYLLEELGLDVRKDLFVVPGNHDGTTDVAEKETYIAAAMGKPMDLNEIWIEKLLGAFADYEAFIKELIPNYPISHPARVHHRNWNDRINFIHCNTALVADGKQKNGQLMDIDNMAAEKYRSDIPNIILAHNSFFDLNDEHQKRVQDIIRNHPICAYLCGDQHIQQVKQITYEHNQNRQIPCVVSYKSSPEAMDTYSVFGMIIGEWEENKKVASLKGWIWRSGSGFEMDTSITEQEIDMCGRLDCSEILENSIESTKLIQGKKGFSNQEKEVEEKTDDQLKKRFIRLYYNMTPAQIDVFNRKYIISKMKLEKKMNSEDLFNYILAAEQKGLLNEMACYVMNLFR